MEYAGLAVFESPLKPGSAPALRMLADSAHQLVMITGDAPLTACYVAERVHIVDRPVAILVCDRPGAATSGVLSSPRMPPFLPREPPPGVQALQCR